MNIIELYEYYKNILPTQYPESLWDLSFTV